jgi:hypothetical protein
MKFFCRRKSFWQAASISWFILASLLTPSTTCVLYKNSCFQQQHHPQELMLTFVCANHQLVFVSSNIDMWWPHKVTNCTFPAVFSSISLTRIRAQISKIQKHVTVNIHSVIIMKQNNSKVRMYEEWYKAVRACVFFIFMTKRYFEFSDTLFIGNTSDDQ